MCCLAFIKIVSLKVGSDGFTIYFIATRAINTMAREEYILKKLSFKLLQMILHLFSLIYEQYAMSMQVQKPILSLAFAPEMFDEFLTPH
jgi:hypothetical protein